MREGVRGASLVVACLLCGAAYAYEGDGELKDLGPSNPNIRYILDLGTVDVAKSSSYHFVVFTACSHAGVVNVLRHARTSFSPERLYAVTGGFHLSAANEKIIPETVRDLDAFGLSVIAPGHCTGWRATHALVSAFGEDVVAPSAVGKAYAL